MYEIHRYEGTITEFTDDGIMALFAAPVIHGDKTMQRRPAGDGIGKSFLKGMDEKEARKVKKA